MLIEHHKLLTIQLFLIFGSKVLSLTWHLPNMTLTTARSFRNKDGQFVDVSRAQVLPNKRKLHVRVLSGDYYWFMTTRVYDLPASNSEMEFTNLLSVELKILNKKQNYEILC
jgi:hypothetical protein